MSDQITNAKQPVPAGPAQRKFGWWTFAAAALALFLAALAMEKEISLSLRTGDYEANIKIK